jgi:hypothetical protein
MNNRRDIKLLPSSEEELDDGFDIPFESALTQISIPYKKYFSNSNLFYRSIKKRRTKAIHIDIKGPNFSVVQ